MFRIIRNIFILLAFSIIFLWIGTLISSPPNAIVLSCKEDPYITSYKIQPGDILLIRGNTWIDKIIRVITGSQYTHVAGVVNSDEAIEILPFNRTQFQKLRSYTGRTDIYTCSDLTAEQRKKIVEHAVERIGTKYDYKLIFWEASRYLFDWTWPYNTDNKSLCSTLWAEAYRKAGVNLCPDIIYPTPGDLGKATLLEKIESY